MFHFPFLYKHVHKQHHEFHSPISISALFCHPLEHTLTTGMPVVVGPILAHTHTLIYLIWLDSNLILNLIHLFLKNLSGK